MNSLIYKVGANLLFGILLVFSVFMLLRGHNEPGGGFIGGLIGAVAFIVYAMSENIKATRAVLRVNPEYLAVFGLAVALFAGLMGPMFDDGLFTGQWLFIGATETSKGWPLSSVLLFDIGVYFTVLGAIVALVLEMERHL
jgi:multicomponent Na+:H+ antiporter subunit B